MRVQSDRVLFETCPLCDARDLQEVGESDSAVAWCACSLCGHLFTNGWLTDEVRESRHEAAQLDLSPEALAEGRMRAARVVTTISSIRGGPGGRWLDAGVGRGGILTTADEFGYDAVGVDPRPHAVGGLRELGYEVHRGELEQFDEPSMFAVVSLGDTLHRTPDPRARLRHVHSILAEDGLVHVATPNTACAAWKALDRTGTHPAWDDPEHIHLFDRDRLYRLLRSTGLQPCHYAVGDGPAVMEVVATKSRPRLQRVDDRAPRPPAA